MTTAGSDGSPQLAWVWLPDQPTWERAHVVFRTTIAGPGIDVALDRPGHHRRIEFMSVTGVDAVGDSPEGYDWIELSVDHQPVLHMIWPDKATIRLLASLRAAPQLVSATPIPTPGPVTDPAIDAATGSGIVDLRERSSRRGRFVALSALGLGAVLALGALGWTIVADDADPAVNVDVLGTTQTPEPATSSVPDPPQTPITDPGSADTE